MSLLSSLVRGSEAKWGAESVGTTASKELSVIILFGGHTYDAQVLLLAVGSGIT